MSVETAPQAREQIRETLHQVGLRSTPSRVAVMGLLQRATGPLSHAEVAQELAEHGFDRATLYRNLMDFAEAGLVTRSDQGDHVWRFELKKATPQHPDALHPHFVCTDCGTVSCLPEMPIPSPHNSTRPLIRSVSEIVIKGQCDDCA